MANLSKPYVSHGSKKEGVGGRKRFSFRAARSTPEEECKIREFERTVIIFTKTSVDCADFSFFVFFLSFSFPAFYCSGPTLSCAAKHIPSYMQQFSGVAVL